MAPNLMGHLPSMPSISLKGAVNHVFGVDSFKHAQFEGPPDADDLFHVERVPSTKEYLWAHRPTAAGVHKYVRDLFPFVNWIFHYNMTWWAGDVIAGVTVGFVVVPQAISYALLANLPPEYGLYTSFVGFLLYWIFATSKDISIGTVAVASVIIGNAVPRIQMTNPEFSGVMIAHAMAVVCGAILLFFGLIRAGFLVEFIPLVSIASFMTSAAVEIGVGQVHSILGMSGNSRDSAFQLAVGTLEHLNSTQLDAALGLSALFSLYFIRWFCGFMAARQPQRQKMWFLLGTLRHAFMLLLFMLISFLINRNIADPAAARFKILGTIPRGFKHMGVPVMNQDLLWAIAPDIPTMILVLLLEHISISKCFGRINNYIIDPSQELVAIGLANVLGPFMGAYTQTGCFSRTAIKSKAGVRTPMAGLYTAIIVLLALYALTSVFFYIPLSVLSAIIIHAVGDLVISPRELYKMWLTSPIEVVIFFAGVLASLCIQLEYGIFVTIWLSATVLMFRNAKSKGVFLGRVDTLAVTRDLIPGYSASDTASLAGNELRPREVFVSLDRSDLSNAKVKARCPYPGVFVYRFSESFNYLNCARHLDIMTVNIFKETRKTEMKVCAKVGDRPWNDPGPRRGQAISEDVLNRPLLRAIILDFSAVNFIDITSVQALIDLRNQFGRYAAPNKVEWHFAGVTNPWTKRALVAAGFGMDTDEMLERARNGRSGPLVRIADLEDVAGSRSESFRSADEKSLHKKTDDDEGVRLAERCVVRGYAPLYGVNRPFFHVDVATAVESALTNIQQRAWPNTPSQRGIKLQVQETDMDPKSQLTGVGSEAGGHGG